MRIGMKAREEEEEEEEAAEVEGRWETKGMMANESEPQRRVRCVSIMLCMHTSQLKGMKVHVAEHAKK